MGLGLWLLLTRTRAGLVIRAVAQNSEMADCLGADVQRVRTLVFGFACALAGLGGVAAAPMTSAYLGMGISVIVDAFVVVVVGGLGEHRRLDGRQPHRRRRPDVGRLLPSRDGHGDHVRGDGQRS